MDETVRHNCAGTKIRRIDHANKIPADADSNLLYAPANRPIIGIVPSQNTSEKFVSVPERYIAAIAQAGGAPLLLPLISAAEVYESLFPLVDGFVLTGGNDIDPARYGEIRDSGKLSDHTPLREDLEYLILSYAYRNDIPLLGICRGMQMINVCFGGTLYLDLEDHFSGVHWMGSCEEGIVPTIQHWQPEPYDEPSHYVEIAANSVLESLLKTNKIMVNSMHHQGIRELSTLVRPVAFAPDDLVEAIEVHDKRFMMGVQWHPEFFTGTHRMNLVFTALIEAADEYRRIPHNASVSLKDTSAAAKEWPMASFAEYI